MELEVYNVTIGVRMNIDVSYYNHHNLLDKKINKLFCKNG